MRQHVLADPEFLQDVPRSLGSFPRGPCGFPLGSLGGVPMGRIPRPLGTPKGLILGILGLRAPGLRGPGFVEVPPNRRITGDK